MGRRGRDARGFTLIEIMVVVVIIAILSALLAPNLVGGSRERTLRREASALAATIPIVQDDAMLYGRDYGLVTDDKGWRFVVWDPKAYRFRALQRSEASWARHELPDAVSVQVVVDTDKPLLTLPDKPADAPAEKSPAPDATKDAAKTGATAEPEPDWKPQAFVLSSGEVTPFTAVIRAEGEDTKAEVRIDPLGNRIDDEAPPHAQPDAR